LTERSLPRSCYSDDPVPAAIYTLSLHDALPILWDHVPPDLRGGLRPVSALAPGVLGITGIETWDIISSIVDRIRPAAVVAVDALDRKSTRLNSSHVKISYAVFCLKKKQRHRAHR